MNVEFPVLISNGKNIDTYVKFAVNNFILAGAKVTNSRDLRFATNVPGCVQFHARIAGKPIFIDLQDSPTECMGNTNYQIYEPKSLDMPIFKVAVRPDIKYESNIFPYGPFHVWNNKTTKDLEKLLSYGNNYNPYANNSIINTTACMYPKTRKIVYSKLDYNKIYKNIQFIRNRVPQYHHWERLSNCLGVLNISGSNTNVVDKAPIEAMWRGVCVVHNDIDILLPHNKQLTKNEHYICIADDYSDINEKINYLYDNRDLAKEMGAKARDLMISTSMPERRLEWILEKVEEYYN
jgi:hypothetical protein